MTNINNPQDKHYYLWVENFAGGIIDQCNYSEPARYGSLLNSRWLFFEDSNGDNYDEIFAITQDDDSLFLYIHDLRKKRVLLKRQFLVKVKPPYFRNEGNFGIFCGGLIDNNSTGNKQFVFAAVSGRSVQPRAVYIFDLKKRKIIRQFDTHATFSDLFLYDLTGDGKKEIILSSMATGNVHFKTQYDDNRSWLFVLDHNLKPVFEPISFGEYPSSLICNAININNQRLLHLTYSYHGEKNLHGFMCFVNPSGKILPKKENYFSGRLRGKPVIEQNHDPPEIYSWMGRNDLIKMNENLNITLKKTFKFNNITTLSLRDLDGDKEKELLCISQKHLLLFNKKFKLLAKYPFSSRDGLITFREMGPDKQVEFSLNQKEQYYHFVIQENVLFSYLPLIFISLTVFIFLVALSFHKISSSLLTRKAFFRYSLQENLNGILILNQNGFVVYSNNKVKSILQLHSSISKGQHITKVFQDKPQVIESIQNGIENGKPVKDKLFFIDSNFHFEGEINVTPNISPFKFFKSFIVEIRDNTQSNLAEKLQIWSNTVQKMVHDIKTPLSSMTLSLKALQMRLQDIQFDEKEPVNQNIEMVRSELNRVYDMTKDFLNFAKLEKPNFQVIEPRGIIEHAISMFQSFPIDKIEIQTEFNAEYNKIWADSQQIELVLHILIENSIDALDGKGLIRISTSLAQYLRKHFMGFLEFEVADSGPGMEPNVQDKIFEPYFTTKENGTGMGLSIAKKIVEEHGGTIGLYSKEGFGTVIRFSLPLYVEDKKITQ